MSSIVRSILFCAAALSFGAALPARALADDSLSDSYAFPVPYRPSDGPHITFTNLPASITIRIFTLNGDLVRKISTDAGDGQIEWDVDNEDGEPVKSGVYLFLLESGGQKKRGKLLVLR
jgi:hypothetical protein